MYVELCGKLQVGTIYSERVAMEVFEQFNKREYLSRTKYRGNLELGNDMNFGVQVYSMTREETFPNLKKYSKNVDENNIADTSKVCLDRQYTEVDDTEQKPIPTDQQKKAFYYGKQLVPVDPEKEEMLKGKRKQEDPENVAMHDEANHEKQFKMLGFCKEDQVPRHHFMQGVDVILPNRGAKNERAFAAIVKMMIETKRVMIAKIIERKNADPKLVSLYPHIENKRPLLYMVQLPTSEDLRDY